MTALTQKMHDLLRDGGNAASSLLCAQPLPPGGEMYGDTSGYKVWTLS